MFTLILAWINAKYKAKYEGLFIVTFIFDYILTLSLLGVLT